MSKKRIIKDFEQLPHELLLRLKDQYPHGFDDHLLRFTDHKGATVSALPFETEDIFYLVRMTSLGGYHLIEEDDLVDDYDDLADAEELDLDDSEE